MTDTLDYAALAEVFRREWNAQPSWDRLTWERVITPCLRLAVEQDRAARRMPEKSPVSAARLALIREAAAGWSVPLASDPSGTSVVDDLLAALDHALARNDELECAWAMLARDEPDYQRAEEAGVAKALAAIERAIVVSRRNPTEGSHLDGLVGATIIVGIACGPDDLPPHEVTLADNRRMREALERIVERQGDELPNARLDMANIARAALGEE